MVEERERSDAAELERKVARLAREVEQLRAWCEGLEARLAEVLALLRLLGIWGGRR